MRVMVLVKATKNSENGVVPPPEVFEAMGRSNEDLVNAGVVLASDGLKPSAKGKLSRSMALAAPSSTDRLPEIRELVAGFSLWEVKDMDEAVAWVKRCPNPMRELGEIEFRPLFDMAKSAESLTPEFRAIRGRVSEKLSGALGPAGAFGGLGT